MNPISGFYFHSAFENILWPYQMLKKQFTPIFSLSIFYSDLISFDTKITYVWTLFFNEVEEILLILFFGW